MNGMLKNYKIDIPVIDKINLITALHKMKKKAFCVYVTIFFTNMLQINL